MTFKDDYYDSIALGYDELYGEEQIKKFNSLKDYFKKAISNKKKISILDLGCGSSVLISEILKFLKENGVNEVNYVGVDYSYALLKLAKKRLENLVTDIKFSYRLYFRDAVKHIEMSDISKFDIITSFTAIQNFDVTSFFDGFFKKINLKKQSVIFSILNRSSSIDYIRNRLIEDFEIVNGRKDDYFIKLSV